ncbi:diguanylate cyclase domain protein, partial [Vibrio parahaemolyticus 861]
PVGDSRFTR